MKKESQQEPFNKQYTVKIDTVPLPESVTESIDLVVKNVTPVINQMISDVMTVAIGTWPTPENPNLGNEIVQEAANHILQDRRGPDYYQNNKLLTEYLQSTLNLSATQATQTATDINQDRHGANYYAIQEILQQFLEGKATNKTQEAFNKQYNVMIDTVPLPEKQAEKIERVTESITPVINQILLDAMTVAIGTWPTPEKPIFRNMEKESVV